MLQYSLINCTIQAVNRTGFDTDTFDTTFYDSPIVTESE